MIKQKPGELIAIDTHGNKLVDMYESDDHKDYYIFPFVIKLDGKKKGLSISIVFKKGVDVVDGVVSLETIEAKLAQAACTVADMIETSPEEVKECFLVNNG